MPPGTVEPPEKVVGLDGKERPAKMPPKPPPPAAPPPAPEPDIPVDDESDSNEQTNTSTGTPVHENCDPRRRCGPVRRAKAGARFRVRHIDPHALEVTRVAERSEREILTKLRDSLGKG